MPTGADAANWHSYASAVHAELVKGIGPTAKPIWEKVLAAKQACDV
jgi:hypothetical protein